MRPKSSTIPRWISDLISRSFVTYKSRMGTIEFFEKTTPNVHITDISRFYFWSSIWCWQFHFRIRAVASFFQRRGSVTYCLTQGTYQIGMSTSTLCFAKSGIFSDEHWAWGGTSLFTRFIAYWVFGLARFRHLNYWDIKKNYLIKGGDEGHPRTSP